MKAVSRTPRFERADAMLLFTCFIWGVNFPIAKFVLNHLPPFLFAGFRFSLASLVLFLLLAARGEKLAVPWSDLPRLLFLGLFGITFFQGLWANGVASTTASKASILVNLSPILAALIMAFTAQAPSARSWVGILLSFVGVFLIINNSFSEIRIEGGTLPGDLMMIGASVFWALYTILAAPLLNRLGPLRVTAWSMSFGSAILLLPACFLARDFDFAAVPWSVWPSFAYTVIFSAALGFAWWYEGVRRIGATRTMVYSYMIPVFAIATAVLFLGEQFSLVQVCGALIVLSGVTLARHA